MPAYVLDAGGTLRTATIWDNDDVELKLNMGTSADYQQPNPPDGGARWHKTAVFQNEEPSSTFGGSWSDSQARTQALAFDLIVVQSKAFTPVVVPFYTSDQLTLMKTTNPSMKMLVYQNAGESNSPTLYPDAYYAHDAAGAKLVNTRWSTYPMQPDVAGWQAAHIASGQARMASLAYDGQFCDVLGDYPVDLHPVKPSTTTLYTRIEWYNMTRVVGAAIVSANPGKFVLANGLGWGTKYLNRSRLLFTQAGGVQAGVSEGFVRTAGLADDARPLANWTDELVMLEDATALGKIVVCIVKDWTTASAALKDERLKFAFGTYMLANNGTHYFAASTSQATTMDVRPWLSGTNYGAPLSARTVDSNGVYFREFLHASIAVNPTTTSRTVTLRGQAGVVVAPQRAVFIVDVPE